jgi:hypothetical protein
LGDLSLEGYKTAKRIKAAESKIAAGSERPAAAENPTSGR